MAPHKILCLSDYFYGPGDSDSGKGGAGAAAFTTLEALEALDVDVSLMAGFHVPSSRRHDPRALDLGGRDVREAATDGAQRVLNAAWNIPVRRRLAEALKKFPPEDTVVLLHQWTRSLSPSALDLLRDYPTAIYMHDYFWFCPTGGYFDFQKIHPCDVRPSSLACVTAACDRAGRVHKALRLVRHAAKSIAERRRTAPTMFIHISERSRDLAIPFLPANSAHCVVYHPVASESATTVLADTDFDVGYFGRFEPEKGLNLLIDALIDTGLRGLFVGEGSMAGKIAERIPHAEVRGWATQAEAVALMRRCGAVVLPSIWRETWGLIVPEALSQGTPAVVSTLAGSAEIVERHGGGVTFDPAIPSDLSRALRQVVADPARRDQYAQAALRSIDAAGLSRIDHGRALLAALEQNFGYVTPKGERELISAR